MKWTSCASNYEHQEEQYRELVENISDVAFTVDAEGYFVYVSPAALTLTGYERENLVGKHFFKLIEKSHREEVGAFYLKQIVEKIPETQLRFPVYTSGGIRKWVEQRVTIHLDEESGEIDRMHAIVRDVTERKIMEDALQRARDEAVAALQFKSQVLANISHDIRTPLNSIAVTTEILLDEIFGALTVEQRDELNTITLNVDQVMMLVRNLLDAARLEEGKLNLTMDDIAPAKLIQQVGAVLQPLVNAKKLTWKTSVDESLPEIIVSDRSRLQQILINLGQNAIQFTEEGTIEIAFCRKDADHWQLSVRDTGSGIPVEAQTHIFETFWQVDSSYTREVQEGVGLGLSIVRQLVNLMEGEIKVESEEGQGTTFTIILPLLEPDEIRATMTEEMERVTPEAEDRQITEEILPLKPADVPPVNSQDESTAV